VPTFGLRFGVGAYFAQVLTAIEDGAGALVKDGSV
jgi:hypothetical protein